MNTDQVNEEQSSQPADLVENLAASEADDGVEGQPPDRIWILRSRLKQWGEYLAMPGTPARFYVEYVPADSVAGQPWQPMDTAPRDGTRILCIDMECEEPEASIRVCYPKMFRADVWEYFRDGKYAPGHTWSMEPTHWMPLPAAPKAQPTASASADSTTSR